MRANHSSIHSSRSSVFPIPTFVHPVPGSFHSYVPFCLCVHPVPLFVHTVPSTSHSSLHYPIPLFFPLLHAFTLSLRLSRSSMLLRLSPSSAFRCILLCIHPIFSHLGCVFVAFFGWREIWTYAQDDVHFQYESMIVHDSNVIGIDVQMVSSFLTWNTLSWHLWMNLLL